MANSQYPNRIDNSFDLQKQIPSYRSEFPQDLPYDPGATSSLSELGYLPSRGSIIVVMPIILVLLGVILFRKKILWSTLLPSLLTIGLLLTFFGPMKLPSILRFNTMLGFTKFVALLLAVAICIQILSKKILPFLTTHSLYPVCLYILSLLSSVFPMTNSNFFLQDFNIAVTGLLFMFLSYWFFSWEEAKRIINTYPWLILGASFLILLIFINKSLGSYIISIIYPTYERSVFAHDLARGRIFSIIDFEYFTPCIIAVILFAKKMNQKKLFWSSLVIFSISFVAIFLINYRYRFLTYELGFILMWIYLPKARKTIATWFLSIGGILFAIYIGISLTFFRSTIIDRFLMKDYSEDVVSVERRFVMYEQAIDIFIQHPILGVGLGNYKDNVQIVYSRYGGRVYEPNYKILQNVYAYPHNWYLTVLAENGAVGFLILTWVLATFLQMDLRLARKLKDDELIIFATISSISWLYLFANLFTMMHVSLPMVIIFWSMRGFIERMYQNKKLIKI